MTKKSSDYLQILLGQLVVESEKVGEPSVDRHVLLLEVVDVGACLHAVHHVGRHAFANFVRTDHLKFTKLKVKFPPKALSLGAE